MVQLSEATRQRLERLFRVEDAAEAERLLVEECAGNLQIGEPATPVSLERFRYAALRASGGDLERLREAVRLAQLDWRDLLMATDFAHDVSAHLRWVPRRFDPSMVESWKAHRRPAGVEFSLDDRVEIIPSATPPQTGRVVSLIGIEPAPLYLVELAGGARIEASQWRLRPIA
jgi:hypothetical protein